MDVDSVTDGVDVGESPTVCVKLAVTLAVGDVEIDCDDERERVEDRDDVLENEILGVDD